MKKKISLREMARLKGVKRKRIYTLQTSFKYGVQESKHHIHEGGTRIILIVLMSQNKDTSSRYFFGAGEDMEELKG